MLWTGATSDLPALQWNINCWPSDGSLLFKWEVQKKSLKTAFILSLPYESSITSSKTNYSECYLVLPLSISSNLSFPEGHPVAAFLFFLVFPSLLFFPLLEGNSYARWNQARHPAFVLLSTGYSFPPSLCVILHQISHDWSNWYSTSFSTTTFRIFSGISDLFPEMP